MITISEASCPVHWQRATALLWDYVTWIREAAGLDPLIEQPSFRAEIDRLDAAYAGDDAVLYIASERARIGSGDDDDDGDGESDGERVVGTVAVRHHADGSSELKRLYVDPGCRGRGLARRLVEQAVDAATARGSTSIWLESVRGLMDQAIALYERHGFVQVPRVDVSFRVAGMVVMERRLCSPVRPPVGYPPVNRPSV